eukprot:c19775_g1_i1.p1 GENE.c19775_g1_i1~~c19775_g1_i1.p1  ORF type:complete len:900 (+),score=219.01 c19775_g1_i1:263-2701(+)
MTPEVQDYIKAGLTSILNSPKPDIRRTVANNITTILSGTRDAPAAGLEKWPDLIAQLVQALRSQDPNLVHGAFETLHLICDDLAPVLDRDILGSRPSNILIPSLVEILASTSDVTAQQHCLFCLNQFLPIMPAALSAVMVKYLQAIFNLAMSQDPLVRKHVCTAFVVLVELRADHMFFSSGINNVLEYMIHATSDANSDVALEACEFWTAICRHAEDSVPHQLLSPVLPRLVPLLLTKMVYSKHELELLDVPDFDADEEDRDSDLKPKIHRGDSDDEEEEEDDINSSDPVGWTIRKCAAAGLDNLAMVFGPDLWSHLQPLLQANFNSPRWEEREASVLALGAVAGGCLEAIQPHLQQLLQYLCQLLRDPQPLIRSITCWTLSRFSSWLVEQRNPDVYLKPILSCLFERIKDPNKRVQQVACSAFATFEDEAQTDLIPYLDEIIPTLMIAFSSYKAKNMLILYDALGTLGTAVGDALNQPKYVNAIIPPIMAKWSSLQVTDKQLLGLLECLTDLSQAIGVGLQEHAQTIYTNALNLVTFLISEHKQALAQNKNGPELDPITFAMDLISGLCVALGPNMEGLILSTQPPLLQVVFESLNDHNQLYQTHQSALALLGDLSKACIGQIRPHLPHIVPLIGSYLNPNRVSVCNNASWATGEICFRVTPEELQAAHIDMLFDRFVDITCNDFNPSLLENCAITLGRLGLVVPGMLAPRVGRFLPSWCTQIKFIHEASEKTHAYYGLVKVVQLNPTDSVPHLGHICDCIGSCNLPDNELHDQLHQLLHGFKTSLGDQWRGFFSQLPEELRARLVSRYKL